MRTNMLLALFLAASLAEVGTGQERLAEPRPIQPLLLLDPDGARDFLQEVCTQPIRCLETFSLYAAYLVELPAATVSRHPAIDCAVQPVTWALLGDDPARKEMHKLQGLWQLVAVEKDGKTERRLENPQTLLFKRDRLTLHCGGILVEGSYQLDLSRTPPLLVSTFMVAGQIPEKPITAVYELHDRMMRMCDGNGRVSIYRRVFP